MICIWCGKAVPGGLVLKGTIAHKSGLFGIGADNTMAGRLFTISGGLKPSDKSTRTIVPGAGCETTVNLAIP